jgi:nuclear receptor subfamily 5 group A protein 3
VSQDVSLSLDTAKERQLEKWVEKMLHFSEQLRRLRIDRYEYVSMKVIVLLTADTSDIKERDTVRQSQEKVRSMLVLKVLLHNGVDLTTAAPQNI